MIGAHTLLMPPQTAKCTHEWDLAALPDDLLEAWWHDACESLFWDGYDHLANADAVALIAAWDVAQARAAIPIVLDVA